MTSATVSSISLPPSRRHRGRIGFRGPPMQCGQRHYTIYYKSEQILILSGDQLYRMNFANLIRSHKDSGADITICVCPVKRAEARRMGLVGVDGSGCVQRFAEKPQEDPIIDSFPVPAALFGSDASIEPDSFLGSMGTYVFEPEVLSRALSENGANDFGTGIFEWAVEHCRVMAYPFSGYWRDIGTVEAFFEANIALARPRAPFELYAPRRPIYTRCRPLPPSRLIGSEIRDSLLSEGSRSATPPCGRLYRRCAQRDRQRQLANEGGAARRRLLRRGAVAHGAGP